MSSHPTQVFTLAEIARAIDVNAPSTLSVLLALTENGYVVRDPRHKTYALGPAVVALGQAALLQHPVLQAASGELKLLADELSAQCVGNVLVGEEIVAIVNEGRPKRLPLQSWVGARAPYSAPFGACFAAYADEKQRLAWLQGVGQSPEARSRLEQELDDVRHHGFAAGRSGPQHRDLADAMLQSLDAPQDGDARQRVRRLGEEIAVMFGVSRLPRDEMIEVSYIAVPVVSPTTEVVMAVTASGFGAPMTRDQISEVAAQMRASAGTISRRAFGPTAAHKTDHSR